MTARSERAPPLAMITLRREREPRPQRSGGRAQRRRIGRGATADAGRAQSAPRAAAPRKRRDCDRPKGRDDPPTAARRERALPLTTSALRREREPPPQWSGGRAQHRRIGCGGTTGAGSARVAPRAAAPRGQRDGDRAEGRDDSPTAARRENALLDDDVHCTESASRRHRGSVAEHNTAASDAALRQTRSAHNRRRVPRRRGSGATATVLKDAMTRRRPPAESARCSH